MDALVSSITGVLMILGLVALGFFWSKGEYLTMMMGASAIFYLVSLPKLQCQRT